MEGTDPVLKDEYIVISGHHDHVGQTVIGRVGRGDVVVGGFVARRGAEHDARIPRRLDGRGLRGAAGAAAEGGVDGHEVDAA